MPFQKKKCFSQTVWLWRDQWSLCHCFRQVQFKNTFSMIRCITVGLQFWKLRKFSFWRGEVALLIQILFGFLFLQALFHGAQTFQSRMRRIWRVEIEDLWVTGWQTWLFFLWTTGWGTLSHGLQHERSRKRTALSCTKRCGHGIDWCYRGKKILSCGREDNKVEKSTFFSSLDLLTPPLGTSLFSLSLTSGAARGSSFPLVWVCKDLKRTLCSVDECLGPNLDLVSRFCIKCEAANISNWPSFFFPKPR